MGEWIILSGNSYSNLIRNVLDGRVNTRDYGRVKLLFIESRKWRNRHVKYRKEETK